MAYINKKKEIDCSNIKTYIDKLNYNSKITYNFDKLIEFLNSQTTDSISKLIIVKKTDNNIQNNFLINNVQSILDKFKN